MASQQYWLMKAEPDSRLVKSIDVKFSVEDFESVGTTPWEGVRNYQARNNMRSMQVGDKVLFYHSNCKVPGIAGFAHVVKEAYPDYTAWDAAHPYYDPKTVEEKPTWSMVDVAFDARAAHFVPLSVLRKIAAGGAEPERTVAHIGPEGVAAVKGMELVTRGRLSVQKVEESAYLTIVQMAENGGWDEDDGNGSKRAKGGKTKKGAKSGVGEGEGEGEGEGGRGEDSGSSKRKERPGEEGEKRRVRRSTRTGKSAGRKEK